MSYQDELEMIQKIYPNKIMLSKQDVADLTSRSLASVNRDLADGTGIPYKKVRGRVLFPVKEVAKWMNELIQTK
jgi:hypothetical protein